MSFMQNLRDKKILFLAAYIAGVAVLVFLLTPIFREAFVMNKQIAETEKAFLAVWPVGRLSSLEKDPESMDEIMLFFKNCSKKTSAGEISQEEQKDCLFAMLAITRVLNVKIAEQMPTLIDAPSLLQRQ